MITLDEKLNLWADDVVRSIRRNFETQKIFPFEVYPGYLEGNAKRSVSKSTGRAYDTILSQLIATGADDARIEFFFNAYLYFVDIGVGRNRPASTIDRVADANHKKRYKKWDGSGDRQSRPVLEMEFKYQIERLSYSLASRFAVDGQLKIIHTLEGIGE